MVTRRSSIASMYWRSAAVACASLALLWTACAADSAVTDAGAGGAGGLGGAGGDEVMSMCGGFYYSGPCNVEGLECLFADVMCATTFTCSNGAWKQTDMSCGSTEPATCDDVQPFSAEWLVKVEGVSSSGAMALDGDDLVVALTAAPDATIGGVTLSEAQSGLVLARHDVSSGALISHVAFAGNAGATELVRAGQGWALSGWLGSALSLDTLSLQPVGNGSPFAVRFDAAFVPQWATTFGSEEDDLYGYVAPMSDGSLVMAATLNGDGDVGGVSLSNAGAYDIALARISASSTLWAQGFGSDKSDIVFGVVANASDEVTFVGSAQSAIDVGGGVIATDSSAIVSKRSSSGALAWVRTCDADTYSRATDIAGDASGNVYVSGFFRSDALDCGTGPLVAGDGEEAFAMKLGPGGEVLWVTLLEGAGNDWRGDPKIAWSAAYGVVASATRGGIHEVTNVYVLDGGVGTIVDQQSFSVAGHGSNVLVTDVTFAPDGKPLIVGSVADGILCVGGESAAAEDSFSFTMALSAAP